MGKAGYTPAMNQGGLYPDDGYYPRARFGFGTR